MMVSTPMEQSVRPDLPSLFFRSVWISDVHLCSRDSQAEMVYSFLSRIKCDYLYLVGDIIDVWALRKKWCWPAQYNEVVHKLLKRSRKGARVIFVPGNHDDFFRQFAGLRFGEVKIELRTIHRTADGRRFLVTHGDEFDAAVHTHPWMAHLGDWTYQQLIVVNRLVNWVRRAMGLPYWSLSGAIKRKVKQAVKYLNNFETLLCEEARRQKVDGVICGHVHAAALRDLGGVLYCNTGDWIETCTALVEHMNGRLELIWWHEEMDARCGDMADRVSYASVEADEPWSHRRIPQRHGEEAESEATLWNLRGNRHN
ncbi:MAG TPA: UDP-2,3-diacylglucosamine diphosphatase [Phycisphaerae bacterium]|nr:UDP-2,3-diacylglucosamine diphosphatase [Phycisphaerae bacterium]